MLLLLVVTAAVSLLPGATSQSEQFFALTECPINYYGESYTEAYTVTTTVRGQLVNTAELSNSETYAYLSGCRHEGQFYPPGTETCASETLFVTCNSTAFLTVSEEDPRCLRKSVCTITVMWRPIDNPSNDVQ
ncbi:uncharacterized protein LOC133487092 isoform X3 [Phyllopteryx taeniolatus]|uniref:uncharacterized protein LOC133487092 isoform X3 n=1 Tax=Phyllopteryx taeniolatus TaxID=161469 RepID=UPI002AD48459|nr:uncharacterized protein LOC133487092 isoform X3 [Phyllopteryx taeniolatus]